MSNISNLEQYLAAEKASRREQQKDVPDSDGSKPFLVSIGVKELNATNKKRADWKQILNKAHGFTGDLAEQFLGFKDWFEKVGIVRQSARRPLLQPAHRTPM